jgi:hypothetical protein
VTVPTERPTGPAHFEMKRPIFAHFNLKTTLIWIRSNCGILGAVVQLLLLMRVGTHFLLGHVV